MFLEMAGYACHITLQTFTLLKYSFVVVLGLAANTSQVLHPVNVGVFSLVTEKLKKSVE